MRVRTSPEETGTVTLCFPEDVQAEAYELPVDLFRKRVWTIPRQNPDSELFHEAVKQIRSSETPVIVAGGGVLYSEATPELRSFAEETGIPVSETQAGKGSVAYGQEEYIGSIGATGTSAANDTALESDLILLLGTRLSDFTTSSKSQFQHPEVKFIHVNVNAMDASKLSALPLKGDARAVLKRLKEELTDYRITGTRSEERRVGR